MMAQTADTIWSRRCQAQGTFQMPNWTKQRSHMVETQLVARGISSPAVLLAMNTVPREAFVPDRARDQSYADRPLPIGHNQTISQPYIVAFMIEALRLKGGEKILEIGTGSGYAAAVLAGIASEVFTIERIGDLAHNAGDVLARLGYTNIHVKTADGTLGWQKEAPFDAIVVTAGGPDVPASLKAQLKSGGRLIIPVGKAQNLQKLVRVTRTTAETFTTETIADVRFVPLLGKGGWKAEISTPDDD
jgi:protein-L-isoaspartate(D-aspartate) O-methyltransferase